MSAFSRWMQRVSRGWSAPRPGVLILHYGLAALLVVIALGLTLIFQSLEAGRPTLFLFFAAIVASASFGGIGPGSLAVTLSVLAGFAFYSPKMWAFPDNFDSGLHFTFFALCAIAGGALNWRQRNAEDRLAYAHRELQLKASELQGSNDTLVAEIAERKRTEFALQETQAELTRVTRLTTMGELVASIAHEINQPLAAITTTAGSCLRWLDGEEPNLEEAREAARRLVRDSSRASDVIRRVRAMLRRSWPEQVPVSVNASVSDAVGLVQHELRKSGIELELDLCREGDVVLGDRVLLQQVFLNLIMNAVEALQSVASRNREIRISSARAQEGVVVLVEDNGVGISDDIAQRLFDAFATTKSEGMGLGLSICRSILDGHGGVLSASARQPFGASLKVVLPVVMRITT